MSLKRDHGAAAAAASSGGAALLAALAASLAFATLGYWAMGEDRAHQAPPAEQAAPEPPISNLRPSPDMQDVRAAYRRVGEIYSERGFDGLAQFANACDESVVSDPQRVDFCVAFALDVSAVAAGSKDPVARAWRNGAAGRELALIASVVADGGNAAQRLAQIRAMTREISLPVPGRPDSRRASNRSERRPGAPLPG